MTPSVDVFEPLRRWSVEALFSPSSRALAVFVIVVSFVFPVGGLGFDLCMLHASTGLPCPGCGMSRAIAAISQGDFSAALGLNPFSIFAWPTFFALAVLTVLPARVRTRVQAWMERSRAAKVYELVFWAFLGFGLLRLGLFMVMGERFP